MREGTILEGFQRITDAISQDLEQVRRANAMLRTRLDAQERLLVGSRCALLKLAVIQLFSPSMAHRMLQAMHTEEIAKFNVVRKQATRDRAKVVAAPSKGLISIV